LAVAGRKGEEVLAVLLEGDLGVGLVASREVDGRGTREQRPLDVETAAAARLAIVDDGSVERGRRAVDREVRARGDLRALVVGIDRGVGDASAALVGVVDEVAAASVQLVWKALASTVRVRICRRRSDTETHRRRATKKGRLNSYYRTA